MNHQQVKSCSVQQHLNTLRGNLWTSRMRQLDFMHRSCGSAQKDVPHIHSTFRSNSKYVLSHDDSRHSQQALVRLLLVSLVGHIR